MLSAKAALGLALLAVFSFNCGGGENPAAAPVQLQIVKVTVTRISPAYPEPDPQDSLVRQARHPCQVDIEVEVIADSCFAIRIAEERHEDAFSFTMRYGTRQCSSVPEAVTGTLDLCLPGVEPDRTPKPPLSPGRYTVEVNGVDTSFDIPH